MRHLAWPWADHGRFYGPMSGWVPDVTLLAGVGAWWHKHNCHEPGCKRPGYRITAGPDGVHRRHCNRHHHQYHQTKEQP